VIEEEADDAEIGLVAVESVKHYLRTLDAQQNQSGRAIV
jgi:hypothetical protein